MLEAMRVSLSCDPANSSVQHHAASQADKWLDVIRNDHQA